MQVARWQGGGDVRCCQSFTGVDGVGVVEGGVEGHSSLGSSNSLMSSSLCIEGDGNVA